MAVNVTVNVKDETIKAHDKAKQLLGSKNVKMPTGSARAFLRDFLDTLETGSLPAALPWESAVDLLQDAMAAARVRIQGVIRAEAEGKTGASRKGITE